MTIEELNKLVDLCLKRRIRQLKLDQTEIYFDDTAFQDAGTGVKEGPQDKSLVMPSDEEMLSWSTPITAVEEPKN